MQYAIRAHFFQPCAVRQPVCVERGKDLVNQRLTERANILNRIYWLLLLMGCTERAVQPPTPQAPDGGEPGLRRGSEPAGLGTGNYGLSRRQAPLRSINVLDSAWANLCKSPRSMIAVDSAIDWQGAFHD